MVAGTEADILRALKDGITWSENEGALVVDDYCIDKNGRLWIRWMKDSYVVEVRKTTPHSNKWWRDNGEADKGWGR